MTSVFKKEPNELRTHLGLFTKHSYSPQSVARDELGKHGYGYDSDLSTMNTKVFTKGGVPTIVHRGSKTFQDWLDDAKIAVGITPQRVLDAQALTKKVEAKYGTGANQIGHSLGGKIAEAATSGKGNVLTYNKAGGLFDTQNKYGANQTDVRTRGDWLGRLTTTQSANRETIENKNKSSNPFINALNAHSTKNLFV